MSQSDSQRTANAPELDLVTAVDTVLNNIWRIVLIAVVVTLAGTAWAFLWPPKYLADIMIQIEDSPDSGVAGNLVGDMSALFDVKSSAAAEAQIIASRMVLERTVQKLRLDIDATPERFPVIGDAVSRMVDSPLRPGLLGFGSFAWGQERAEFKRFDVPKALEDERFTLTVEAAGGYTLTSQYLDKPVTGRIGVERTVITTRGPVVIDVARLDAAPGVRFKLFHHPFDDTVSQLQRRFDVQEKVKQSGVIVATLLGRDALRTSQTLQEIGEQYVRQNVERKYADAAQSLAFLSAQLPALRQKLEAAQTRYTKLRDERGVIDLPAEANIGLQQRAETQTQIALLQQKRAELVLRFTTIHPSVRSIDEQIAVLRAHMDESGDALRRLPDVEQDAARLMLDVKVNTDLYTTTLNNAQQLQLVKAGKIGSVRVIDTPVVLDAPAWPKRPLVIAASALAGVLLGLMYAFAREFFYGGAKSAEEIEDGTSLAVLSSITFSANERTMPAAYEHSLPPGASMLASVAPHDQAVESLRSLRTALRMSLTEGRGNVVLLTSPAPGAGKSFITANLSAVLASTGQRVLVIDCDLRRPTLHVRFGTQREVGMSELLDGKSDVMATVHRIESLSLDFIAAGAEVANPAELLQSPRTTALIDSLRNLYDIVLIDTPPMLAVEDAAPLAALADAVLLVARAGVTRMSELRESARRLHRGGAKAPSVVLNGLPLRSMRSAYGSYHYAHYQYGAPAKPSIIKRALRACLRRS